MIWGALAGALGALSMLLAVALLSGRGRSTLFGFPPAPRELPPLRMGSRRVGIMPTPSRVTARPPAPEPLRSR